MTFIEKARKLADFVDNLTDNNLPEMIGLLTAVRGDVETCQRMGLIELWNKKKKEERNVFLKRKLETFEGYSKLSTRLKDFLEGASVETVIAMTESDFLRIPNFGRKSLKELKCFLNQFDLYLSED